MNVRLFADAFKAEPKAAPKPHLGQNWRINNTKARGLSFTEQYALGELADVPYRDLPDWVRDGGYAEPSADEKRHQKEQLAETGLTQSERNQVFNAFAAHISALADMSEMKPAGLRRPGSRAGIHRQALGSGAGDGGPQGVISQGC